MEGSAKQHILSHIGARNAPRGRYGDGVGLWLHKRAHGKWVLRYFLHGKRREMGLGRWPDVSIAEARTAAADARATLRGGQCPIEARRQERRVIHRLTVSEAIDSCFEARKAQLKGDGKAGRWMSPLQVHVIPKIGTHTVEEVDQHVLRDLLAPIATPQADLARENEQLRLENRVLREEREILKWRLSSSRVKGCEVRLYA